MYEDTPQQTSPYMTPEDALQAECNTLQQLVIELRTELSEVKVAKELYVSMYDTLLDKLVGRNY